MKRLIKTSIIPVLLLLTILMPIWGAFSQETTPTESAITDAEKPDVETEKKFIVYYFHGNKRCVSCRKIEMFTGEALFNSFENELESGKIEWKKVNVDNPDNKHFVEDFQLVTKSVVVTEVKDGEVIRWKNLPDVWKLTYKKDAFREYISSEVSNFLKGN